MLAAAPVEASCNRAADGRSRATIRAEPLPAAASPAGFIGHIHVPDRFAAVFGRASRQSCRLVDVEGEPALEVLRPGEVRRAVDGRCRPVRAGWVGRAGVRPGHDPEPLGARRREHAVVSRHVGAGLGHQCSKTSHEVLPARRSRVWCRRDTATSSRDASGSAGSVCSVNTF